MSETWQVQEAKARFSEFLAAAERDGPQIVTRRGVETAVLVPIAQWRSMEKRTKRNIEELLLAPESSNRKSDASPHGVTRGSSHSKAGRFLTAPHKNSSRQHMQLFPA